MCPPSAQKDCILAIMRPLPDSPSTIRAEATAYTYKSNCEKIGNGTKIGHDGTATLDDAPGGSIGIQGFLNDNFTDEHKYNWAAVKFTHASDGPGLMGLKHTVPNADEQGSLWTCGNVDGISRCHITIHC
ncbi:hypothetical protein AAP_05736 [Ascosphaera apis ARSEF 7405]|uniref:Uncharacterized protein n=1 Tax=Ascosphaera apis ARSEF 7405 TaxID=392613 RepID=A0A167VCY5_9EURO|nr:hypothetical protein AAP_05736 [Ascosphaera apis ARSEF 7405]